MSKSRYVVFNCSRGPITLTLYKQADMEELGKLASYHRRKLSRHVFHVVVIPMSTGKDLVEATGLDICELENNRELQHLLQMNKLKLLTNTEHPECEYRHRIAAAQKFAQQSAKKELPQPVAEPLEKIEEVVAESDPEPIISDFIEEVVDEEELRATIIEDSDAIDRGDGEEEVEVVEEVVKTEVKKASKSVAGKKRGRKPTKKAK